MKNHTIKLIVYDFDGVMTDNKVYVDQKGVEMVQVSRADGLGVSEIKKLNIKQIIISTEKNPVVSSRAKKLGIPCFHGINNKRKVLVDYCNKNKIDIMSCAYVGNDINDKQVMEVVGFSFSPSDAHQDIINLSDHVFSVKGGQGVIRELLDYLIINNHKMKD